MSRAKFIRWKPVPLLAAILISIVMPIMAMMPVNAAGTFTAISSTEIQAQGLSGACPNMALTYSNGSFSGTCNAENCTSFHTTGVPCSSTTYTITNVTANGSNFTGNLSGVGAISIAGNGQTKLGSATASSGGSPNTAACTNKDANGNCTVSNPDAISCTSGFSFTAVLNWILCSAINLAWGAANVLDNWIMNTLDVDVAGIFDNTGSASSASHGYYVAWNSFRVIATAFLIIGGLIMVTAQAVGFEALDAYTVRKVLPRILIAVIGISLSWPLMRLVVDFFDTAGLDIREIMYAPFQTPAMHGTVNPAVGALSLIGLGSALLVMGPASLTFLLTAMLAAFVGFLILVIRQIAIVMLVILAPIAIACYILPNTQKVWKLWYDNFLGLMLMFPIISALIAAGHIFSAVTLKEGSGGGGGVGNGVVAQAIGLIAYFAPYFLIPMAARMATGVIGNIAGFVNDRHKGVFDRLKGARSNASARNMAKMKAGTRFSERNALTRGFNNTSAGLGSGMKGHFGVGRRGSEARDLARRTSAANDIMKDPKWAAIGENDEALRALTYDSAGEARAALLARNNAAVQRRIANGSLTGAANIDAAYAAAANDADTAVATAQSSVGFGRAQAIAAAQQLATTGTGYADMEEQVETIARASGGNRSTAGAIAGYNNFINKQKGRYDLAPGAGGLIGAVNNSMEGNGAANDYNAMTVAGSRAGDPVSVLRGKSAEMQNLSTALQGHLNTQWAAMNAAPAGSAARQAAQEQVLQTASQIRQLVDSKSYASSENQQIVAQLDANTRGLRSGPLAAMVQPATPGRGAQAAVVDPTTGAVVQPVTPATPGTPAGPLADDWQRVHPTPRNMNDPNLP